MKIIRIPIFLFIIFLYNQGNAKNYMTIYDFSFEDIDGNIVNLEKFIGNPILIVNTASRCGFTPQYENLQNLFIEYRKTDLTIIAITSNSFNQEYSSLLTEQKTVLGLFINDRVALNSFLNEEIARLRVALSEGLTFKEIQEDNIMTENTEKIIQILDDIAKTKLTEQVIIDILKIQKLVSEIQSDDN